ncbi:Glu/Leu/Phe/Val dehydrogenase dimerization domain-containing protein [Cohaesibacter celericrescens]|uniref:Amino acid dehydrogenase n=1 Tax=Cohaesibacter celericrescens TaxID=2067669 RepID=A0A2N5XL72_9HYPH|nr:Glu/Leu/Phe/Val dehydrogenase dimerization domain-containing protein [Cohaesibacter celericrescens]PLW75281.1 amino acid dehydrogenase [Cohaesibacter celericrescens]
MNLITNNIKMPATFDHPEFHDHEQVLFCSDKKSRLRAIIAVHNTNLGPAIGGCRMWAYDTGDAALTDALRLSRGMTYKNALAGLPHGGGKSVILGDSHTDKTPDLLRAFAHHVKCLAARYITAEDVGITNKDADLMASIAPNVGGTSQSSLGDPSPFTALGVYCGIKSAAQHMYGSDNLAGKYISVKGLGNVGFRLADYLHKDGAKLILSDVYEPNLKRAVEAFGAQSVSPDEAHAVDCDIFAPCALGAGLNSQTIPAIQAAIVAGAANNQLETNQDGVRLMERGILYAPDYVINAGGVIAVAEPLGPNAASNTIARTRAIGNTLSQIFTDAQKSGKPTAVIADRLAEQRFMA